jgi:lipopolysaccharide transport system ATP-binding protein
MSREDFWALRDVSLEVERGEVIGLIGANGAGKSTLLKLLSQITPPTEGRISLWGRVATMLEVGTGFHPELTGRENVYLNGSILGMRRREIDAKFDQIVEFSGIPDFIDTPVKRYSSGMYVRLAFAVAANLEPEILLIDEVLAVGDAEFQRKCLGKMRDVADDEGRTIVFVSHNLSAVQRLCTRSYWLHRGQVAAQGPSQEVIAAYLKHVGSHQRGGVADVADDAPRHGTGDARLRRVEMVSADGDPVDRVMLGQRFSLRLTYEVNKPIDDGVVELGICAADRTRVITVQNIDGDRVALALEPGTWVIEATFETTLLPGDFTVDAGLHRRSGLTWDYAEQVFAFSALNVAPDSDDHYPWEIVRGSVRTPTDWAVHASVETAALGR